MARTILIGLLLAAATARAELLPNDYEKMSYAQALERIKSQPERHILLYFGMETFCPPCNRSDLEAYTKANFNAAGSARVVPEAVAQAAGAPVDGRPRLRDVLEQKHERVAGDALRKPLPGMRMEEESQDRFLTLQLSPTGVMHGAGQRKDGKGTMKGDGKWYVTKKGKLCVELKAGGADETWCRHVFRVGGNYYCAVKGLRLERLAYRFTLEKT